MVSMGKVAISDREAEMEASASLVATLTSPWPVLLSERGAISQWKNGSVEMNSYLFKHEY